MSMQAPLWALAAEAIDGVGDTHLPPGIHVRALPSVGLGVPAAPLMVTRSLLTAEQVRSLVRSDGITWVDSTGATRATPFTVTPDNPVYGHFATANAIYAELQAVPGNPGPAAPPAVPGPGIADLLNAGPGAILANLPALHAAFDAAANAPPPVLVLEALANSGLGVAQFQSRTRAPYAIAAWTIPLVRVSGTGSVRGMLWIDTARLKPLREEAWALWSLPVGSPMPRYTPTPAAAAEAKDRVTRAGVTLQPMYVANASASPAACPPAPTGAAAARVGQVQPELDRWLKALLTDLTVPAWQVTDTQAISGQNGTMATPIEPFLLGGAVDADVAHYLGLGDKDEKVTAPAGSLVFYRVRGLWRWDPARWLPVQAPAFSAAIRAKPADAIAQFPELKDFAPREKGPFVDLFATAVAIVGVPPARPGAVAFDDVQDRGWLASPPPPAVRRALRLLASRFLPHPVAALAATDTNGDRSLNPYRGAGRIVGAARAAAGTPLPIIVSRPNDALGAAQGRFEDRDAPDSPVLYRLAQGDWFGRWGPWRTRQAPAKARTPPMRPTIELFPQPPGTPMPPAGPLAGTIQVRIPIPRNADLPPGGSALARLDLDESFAGSPAAATSYTLAALAGATIELHPAPAHDLLVISRAAPALLPSTSRKVTYMARWVDTLALVSADSDPAARTIVDPRPPPAPPVITELRYTARPDAQGHARVDLDFGSVPGTRYRVFFSTETQLLHALDTGGQAAAAAEIRAAQAGAPRAGKFRDFKLLFGWDDFECLTKQSIVAAPATATTHFVHRVSGSLDVLAIYRVIGEGESGALGDLTQADLVPFAVPNLGGPSRPLLSVLNGGLDPITQGVQLRVKVPIGKAVPKAWRLRRASVPTNDPMRMNLVAQGPVALPVVESEGASFEITSAVPLQAWRRYRFAVEVQAADPPGAPTVGTIHPGEWSEPSAPAALAVIPPLAPAAPSQVQIANTGGALQVTITHPQADSLVSTAMGSFHFEFWRVQPGRRPDRRELLFTRGPGSTWVAQDSPAAPPGTYASIRVIDPIGRRSDGAVSNQI